MILLTKVNRTVSLLVGIVVSCSSFNETCFFGYSFLGWSILIDVIDKLIRVYKKRVVISLSDLLWRLFILSMMIISTLSTCLNFWFAHQSLFINQFVLFHLKVLLSWHNLMLRNFWNNVHSLLSWYSWHLYLWKQYALLFS